MTKNGKIFDEKFQQNFPIFFQKLLKIRTFSHLKIFLDAKTVFCLIYHYQR